MSTSPPARERGFFSRVWALAPFRTWLLLAALIGGIVGLGVFTFAYAQGASYLSDDPSTCVNCHIMREVYDGWNRPTASWKRYPAMVRIWAGYAFSKDHNEERGHYYAQIDQEETERVQIVNQPGACANCHAAEAPQLIAEMGWEEFNSTPYNDLKDRLHLGSSAPTAMIRKLWNCASPARR
jgi:nitrate/TMAO reductase-like tetraheme cytochrome c subunit